MKKWIITTLTALCFSIASFLGAAEGSALRVGYVDFKTAVENSKIGKQEQASFDAMKGQMEKVVSEKESVLSELATKLNDPDQLDLMSPEAETEMKRKFRALSQELQQIQQQYYQTLNQANFAIVKNLNDNVAKASKKVAEDSKLDFVLNSETTFFAAESLNITSKVVAELDKEFDAGTITTTTGKK